MNTDPLQATAAGTVLAIVIFLVEIALFILRQQKEQKIFETDEKTKIMPFGVPGSDIRTKEKKD
jgi:hypothetical protein